jgi:hypothetical protein
VDSEQFSDFSKAKSAHWAFGVHASPAVDALETEAGVMARQAASKRKAIQ